MYIVTEDNFLKTLILLPSHFIFNINGEDKMGYFEMSKRNSEFQFNYINYNNYDRTEHALFKTQFFYTPISSLNFLIGEIEKVSPHFISTYLK